MAWDEAITHTLDSDEIGVKIVNLDPVITHKLADKRVFKAKNILKPNWVFQQPSIWKRAFTSDRWSL